VDADLDTLATALYVRTDDLLKLYPEQVPYRPQVGIAPQISDAEVITLSVMQALLAFTPATTLPRQAKRLPYTGSHSNFLALLRVPWVEGRSS